MRSGRDGQKKGLNWQIFLWKTIKAHRLLEDALSLLVMDGDGIRANGDGDVLFC